MSSFLIICSFRQKKNPCFGAEKARYYYSRYFMNQVFVLDYYYFPAAEDTFLSAIINYTNSSTVHFKLSPTYVLYMACRFVLSPSYRPDMSPSERTHKVIAIVNKMVSMMEGVIQVSTTTFQIIIVILLCLCFPLLLVFFFL